MINWKVRQLRPDSHKKVSGIRGTVHNMNRLNRLQLTSLKQLIRYLIVHESQFNPLTDDLFILKVLADTPIPDETLTGLDTMFGKIWDQHFAPDYSSTFKRKRPSVSELPKKTEIVQLVVKITNLDELNAIQIINETPSLTSLYAKCSN